jgi:HSP20 family protein
VPPDELRIDFENSVLTLHGRVQDRHPEPGGMLLQEYGVGDFHRPFRVDESIDPEGIHAECCNGTLVLHLPKGKVAGPRRIEIKSS